MVDLVKPQRPRGITIIAIWFVLEGIFFFYQNSFGMFGGQNIPNLFEASLQNNFLMIYGLGITFFNFVVAWAFWDGKHWIRLPTIIVLSISIIVTWTLFSFQLVSAFESILGTILTGIVVIYMMKSNVKNILEKHL